MGICGLIKYLSSYARDQCLENLTIVIDGNSLAHHLYELWLASRPLTQKNFETQPNYREFSEFSLTWLDSLCKNNVFVEKIFFDGFLPHSKLRTRSKRLIKLTSTSQKYYESSILECQELNTCNGRLCLSGLYSTGRKMHQCPPLLFIVPAILELLLQSQKYQHKTEVVPWEADHYCASYVKEFGGLILTGDSDLLLYDLGPNGKVAFFKDMEPSVESHQVAAAVYHPISIIDKLRLESPHGLCALAFELLYGNRRDHTDVPGLALSLRAANSFPDRYEKFREEYTLEIPESKSPTEDLEMNLFLKLKSLDPRISEYILRFPSFAKVAQQPLSVLTRYNAQYRIFLPFLFDSPVKSSGWEISVAIRKLAYGLINTAIPEEEQIKNVYEHRRLRVGLGGLELGLPTTTEISVACASHCQLFFELENNLSNLCSHEIWIARAILQELGWCLSQSKPSLSDLIINELHTFKSSSGSRMGSGWEFIHFSAQIDASLYSFRILYQISGIIIAGRNRELIPAAVLKLHQLLESLPNLKDFKDRDSVADFLNDHLDQILSTAKQIFSVYTSDTIKILF